MKKFRLFISLFLMGALAACSSSDDLVIDNPTTPDGEILRGETVTFKTDLGVGTGDTNYNEGTLTRGKGDVDENGKPIGKYRLDYIFLNLLTENGQDVTSLKFNNVQSTGFNVLVTQGVRVEDGTNCIIIGNGEGDEIVIPAKTEAAAGRRFFFSSVGSKELRMQENDYLTIGGQKTYAEIGDNLLRSVDYTVTLKNGTIQFYTLFNNKWESVNRPSILPIYMERLAGAFSIRLMFTGDYYEAGAHGTLSIDPEVAEAFNDEVGYLPEDIICGGVMIAGFPTGYNLLEWKNDPLSMETGAAVVCPTRYDVGIWDKYLSIDDPSTFLYPGSETTPAVQGLGFACNSAPFLFPMEFTTHQKLIFYLATKDKFDEANGNWEKAFFTVFTELGSLNEAGSATHILANQNNYIYVKASTANLKSVIEKGYAAKTRGASEPIRLDAEIEVAVAPLAE